MNTYNYLPDAFVVEGPKAGGHLGFRKNDLFSESVQLENLVTDVLTITKDLKEKYKKNIPVIAAGGIVTGKQIHELLDMGASAVQIGTRFIATKECDASEEFKNAIINSNKNSIRIIKSPVGLPGRAIENEFLIRAEKGLEKPKSCKYNCIKSCNPKTTNYCIADALFSAYSGNLKNGFAFTGANAHLISSISSVAEVFQQLTCEYKTEMQIKAG
jgi:NAD(P)H-dependent flavin oxidoreductase YrpB (nitropropane dioxygenase family)